MSGYPQDAGGVLFDGGNDTDTLQVFQKSLDVDDFRTSTLSSIERLVFSPGGPSGNGRIDIARTQIGGGLSDTLEVTGSAIGNRIFIDLTGSNNVDLSGWTFSSWTSFAALANESDIINIIGTNSASTLTGSSVRHTITGGASSGQITGGAGVDYLIGGDGNDSFILNTGDYTPVGLNRETIEGGNGSDSIKINGLDQFLYDLDVTSIETIYFIGASANDAYLYANQINGSAFATI